MDTIKDQTRLQLELDQCTGKFAIDFRAAAVTMQESYIRINAFRTAAIAICEGIITCPAVVQVANQYMKVERTIQTVAKQYWTAKQILWKSPVFNGCSIPILTFKSTIPDFPFQIIQGDASDLLNPLELNETIQQQFSFALRYQNKTSTAAIQKKGWFGDWKVLWIE